MKVYSVHNPAFTFYTPVLSECWGDRKLLEIDFKTLYNALKNQPYLINNGIFITISYNNDFKDAIKLMPPFRDSGGRLLKKDTQEGGAALHSIVMNTLEVKCTEILERIRSGKPITPRLHHPTKSRDTKTTTGAEGTLFGAI